MTAIYPDRRTITDWLLEHVKVNFTATDVSPEDRDGIEDFGWQGDMHGEGVAFNPYVVITPQTATRELNAIGATGADWTLPYLFTVYGVDRRQAEDLADDVRNYVSGDYTVNLTSRDGKSSWRVSYIECMSIGGIGFNSQVQPRMYSQTDSFTLKVSRRIE